MSNEERFLDDTTLLLLYLDRESLLVELYLQLGVEVLKKLITVFGGTSIDVPSMQSLQMAIRDVRIYKSLRGPARDEDGVSGSTVNILAGEYNISPSRVRTIASEVHQRLTKLETENKDWVSRLKTEFPDGGIV